MSIATSPPAPPASACIGVFDSGVGGLSVLRRLQERLPGVPLLYLADSAYAPYGGRSAEDITARCMRLTQHLVDQGAALIVVACNTATTAAIGALRARWPQLAFVGVEPGIKPAVARSARRRIAVMATRATLDSLRVRQLVDLHAGDAHVHLQACPGLVDVIEQGRLEGDELRAVLRPFCDAMQAAGVDTVVLGCTHYPFVADTIQALLGPEVTLVDTADAVAQRAADVWTSLGMAGASGSLRLQTTGNPALLGRMARRWLGTATPAEAITLA